MKTDLEQLKKIKENPTHSKIISYFSNLSEKDDNIRCVYVFGSKAQKNSYADEHSDLDIAIVLKDKKFFIEDMEWTKQIDKPLFSYLQPTSVKTGMQVRTMYENMENIDFVFMNQEECNRLFSMEGIRNGILGRGIVKIIDKDNILDQFDHDFEKKKTAPEINQETFEKEVRNALFHIVYAKKKLMQGENLTAKNTIDVSLRDSLMKFIRWDEHIKDPEKDLWHRARNFERWASEENIVKMAESSPRYHNGDMDKSLMSTIKSIEKLTEQISSKTGLKYEKDEFVKVKSWLDKKIMKMFLGLLREEKRKDKIK